MSFKGLAVPEGGFFFAGGLAVAVLHNGVLTGLLPAGFKTAPLRNRRVVYKGWASSV